MIPSITFDQFLEQLRDELPALAEQVELRLLKALRGRVVDRWGASAGRGDLAEAAQLLQSRPYLLARALAQAIARRIDEERRSQNQPPHAAIAPPLSADLALSLMDEDEVEQGIEQVRIERQIEQAGEWTLRELRSLCAGLPGRQDVEPDEAYPLTPALAAESLSIALADMKCQPGLRLAMMQAAGEVLAEVMAQRFETDLNSLREAGVVPAPMRIRSAPAGRPLPSAVHSDGSSGGLASATEAANVAAQTQEALGRMFASLASSLPAAGLDGRSDGQAVKADPGTSASGSRPPSAMPAATSEQLSQLIRILARQSQSGPAMRAVWQRLLDPVQRLGPAALLELQNTEHPFWRLLDRIAALSSVQSNRDPEMRELADKLEPVLAELERSDSPSTDSFDTALLGLDTLPSDLELPTETLESTLDLQARKREIEPAVKGQLVWQLRSLSLPPVLNQFLLGPWVQVMSLALAKDGPDAPATMRYMNLVADLLAAVSQLRRGVEMLPMDRQPLLDVVEEGMQASGLPVHVVQGNLTDLAGVLAGLALAGSGAGTAGQALVAPASAERDASLEAAASAFGPEGPGDEWQGHAELATVPMSFDDKDADARADREAWLAGLKVGSLCRLMLQGRWATALLSWRSENGMFYMFKSRHAAGSHTLTRRALERMRSEGLATSIEPGQLLARALSALQ